MRPDIMLRASRLAVLLVTGFGLLSVIDARGDEPVRAPIPGQSGRAAVAGRHLPTLDEVIVRLREHEAKWANAEFFLRRRYELVKHFDDPPPELVLVGETTTRCVYLGERAYLESAELHKSVDGSSTSRAGVSAYDGQRTVSIEGGPEGITAVILDRRHPPKPVLPHGLLLHHERVWGALSEFLTNPRREGHRFETYILDYESTDGRKCIRVRKRSWRGQGPPLDAELVTIWDLWLDIDRSYLPLRLELWYSNGRLVSEAVVTEPAQARSGVWYPQSISVTSFDTDDRGARIPARLYEYTLRNVRLNPAYSPEFFRSVMIPPGTQVRIVRDGKIVDEFIQPGEPEEADE